MSEPNFELQRPATEGSRRAVFIIAGVIALIVIGIVGFLVFRLVTSPSATSSQRLEGAIRAGSPEWAQVRERVVLDPPEAEESTRPLGDIVMVLTTTVRNFSGRTITGLEVQAAVLDPQDNPIRERTAIVIPGPRAGAIGQRIATLGPNETVTVPVMLQGIPQDTIRANIRMEMTGVRFE